ncbi:ATP-binding protein [Spirillospora sp. NPDC029432]|uniref:ATP-binding protein n=1 Tax=Spirillospora sp. NPDC029432 TaxID=3154599 RepID=UPI003455A38B
MPESRDLPHRLDLALRALVGLTGPTVSFTVLPEPESVTEARHFALSRLDGWGGAALADDVGLVVSELVTNALRHSGAPAFARPAPHPVHPVHPCDDQADRRNRADRAPHGSADPLGSAPAAIRLRLLHQAPWLLCGIMDASPEAPRRKEPDYIAETGRGLHLVESFSVRWGWCGLPQGKIVWALFRAP